MLQLGLVDILHTSTLNKKRASRYAESLREWFRSGRNTMEWFYELNTLVNGRPARSISSDNFLLQGIYNIIHPSVIIKKLYSETKTENQPYIKLAITRKEDYKPDGRKLSKLKTVYQYYSIKGGYIREWENVTEAAIGLEIPRSNISLCLNGFNKSAGGYYFTYQKLIIE